MKTRFCLLIGAGLLLAGCETGPAGPYGGPLPPPPPQPPRSEFAWSTAGGPNVVEGSAVWRRDHHVFTCAGQSVGLTPETPYTRRRMVELYGSDEQAIRSVAEVRARSSSGPSRDYRAYVRSTQCDGQGRFTFRDLPDGGWFVIVRGASRSGAAEVAMRHVRVEGGETRAVRIGV
jgi:hypothetical protein